MPSIAMRRIPLAALLLLAAGCAGESPLDPQLSPSFANIVLGEAQITGRFSNAVDGENVMYCGGTGQNSCSSLGFGATPPVQGRWGYPADGSRSNMSGLGFEPGTGTVSTNQAFLVGTVSHFNFPIVGSSAASGITLTLGIAIPGAGFSESFPVSFEIDETSNQTPCTYPSTTPCADRIAWSIPQPKAVVAGGNVYALNIKGFRATETGPLLPGFISQEGGTNTARLYAELVDATAQLHAIDDAYDFTPGAALTVAAPAGLLSNDVGVTKASVAVEPDHGTLALAETGGFTYTPDAGFQGNDSFVYFGRLANGELSLAVVTLSGADVTAPVVTAPANRTVEATSAAGAAVTWPAATATDDRDGAVVVACSPASGSTFPLGETQVVCRASDAAGNEGTASFTIRVQDTTAPTLTLPADLRLTTAGSSAVATFQASASDLVDGAVPRVCSPASGSAFPAGTTTVSCTATDAAGNTATGSFTVTVVDAATLFDGLAAAANGAGSGRALAQLAGNARAAYLRGDTGAACGQLGAFLSAVSAQNGGSLTAAQAAQLDALAAELRALLGC